MLMPFLPIEQGPIVGPVELHFANEREAPSFLPGACKFVIQEWCESRGATLEGELADYFCEIGLDSDANTPKYSDPPPAYKSPTVDTFPDESLEDGALQSRYPTRCLTASLYR
jgi:hypothetical protein